jgi:hypothetical protein
MRYEQALESLRQFQDRSTLAFAFPPISAKDAEMDGARMQYLRAGSNSSKNGAPVFPEEHAPEPQHNHWILESPKEGLWQARQVRFGQDH